MYEIRVNVFGKRIGRIMDEIVPRLPCRIQNSELNVIAELIRADRRRFKRGGKGTIPINGNGFTIELYSE